ncbi:MAG: UDP-N-acetylmuramoyl-L-alanine--D-glutamate ligase [bacterium]
MSFLIKYLKNKKVAVLGAGMSGIAVAQLLKRNEVEVFISESQPGSCKQKEKEMLKAQKIPCEFGGHTDLIYKADLLVISPGISLDDKIAKKAEKMKISVYGELEISSWYCRAPIIAVTGSNGKSTTTELIGYIFKNAGRSYEVVGNIGKPFAEIADSVDENSTAVVEVSSFQLETIKSFRPHIAVFLNLTPDHLDRHDSMQEYGKMKARIFENQTSNDYLIYNGEDPYVSELIKNSESHKIVFNRKQSGGFCGYIDHGTLIAELEDGKKELIGLDEMYLKGEHNAANAVAAALSARIMNIDWESIQKSLKNFKGLPHRMEFVRKKNDVVWINDSKATNVDSVRYALQSFSTPVILIAGGRDKGADFSELHDQVARITKQVILLGEAASTMEKAFKGISVKTVKNLKEAVKTADKTAEPGDTVLLSPCCTSFDMFPNFEQRGNTFKSLVNNL